MPETFDLDDDLDGHDGPADNISQSSRGGGLRTIIIAFIAIVVVVGGGFTIYRMIASPDKDANSPNAESSLTDEEVAEQKEQDDLRNKKVKYEMLYIQLTAVQASAVARELSYSGILFETEQKGKYVDVLVDRDRMQEARKSLALKGLPAGGIVGYEIFDNASNMGVTDFDKRVRFIRAISGELEKAIIQLESIEGAKVQVVMPEQRLFAVAQPPVTAAILVRRRPYIKRINDETVYGIIKLVSNAVENLQPENVTVVDTDGHVLSEGVFERMRKKVGAKTARISDIDAAFHNSQVFEENSELMSDAPASDADRIGQRLAEVGIVEKKAKGASLKEDAGQPGEKINLQDFLAYKKSYEADLTQKAEDQMGQIMNKHSYRVSVSTEMDPPKSTADVPDVKKISVSIVLNQLMADANLTPLKKKTLFSTVGSAVGYTKGRDTITLSKSDFVMPPEPEPTPAPEKDTAVVTGDDTVVGSVSGTGDAQTTASEAGEGRGGPWLGILKWIGIGILAIAAIGAVGYGVIKLFKGLTAYIRRMWRWLNSSDSEAAVASTGATSSPELDTEIDTLRQLATTDPEKVARVMEQWLQESEVPVR